MRRSFWIGLLKRSKKVIFDILCEDSEKNTYLLEMQNAGLKNAGNRLRLYIARIQSENIDKGNENYSLPSSFFVGILNYKRNDSKFFFTEECWFNLQTKSIANKNDFRVFVELPKFDKTAEQCKIFRDKIIFLFKNLHTIKERPENFNEEIFDRIFSIAEISKLKGDDLKAYRYSMKYVDERKLAIDYAVEEATEITFKQGVFKTAKNMLKDGLDLARVARITGLPKKQILALK